MSEKIIKLNEEQLRQLIKESVNAVLNEIGDTEAGARAVGLVARRANDRAAQANVNMNKASERGDDISKNYWKRKSDKAMGTLDTTDNASNGFWSDEKCRNAYLNAYNGNNE